MYSQQRFPTPQRLQFRRNGPQQNLAGSRMPQTRRQNPLRTQRPVRLEASVPRVQPQGVRPSVPERQTVHRNKVKLLKSQRPTGKATPMDRQWPQRQDEFRGQSRGQVQGRPGMVRSTGTFRPTGSNSGQRTRGLRCFDLVTSCRHFADANSCGKSNFVRQNCRRTCQIC
ncbi:uncharacterized protein LOC124277230 [Haliotis rubra]|uniref:uncharacterized protein LOC124277230 n=1 Tax=Haliotis rubra TaxID=36100 RepID=UPI001EE4FD41|nr:uncharacterized protein LOC124277230 [Haliotis rubra]